MRTYAVIIFLLSFSMSAFAVNCEKLQAKIQKVEAKGKRAGKIQRLKDKYQALCVDKKSKSEWKSQRQANKGQYKSLNKCSRLTRKLERAQSKGNQKRIEKIQAKMAECSSGQISDQQADSAVGAE